MSFLAGAASGCGLGAIGSGSTLGVDWPDTAPYDSGRARSSAMRGIGLGLVASSGDSSHVDEGQEGESSRCAGAELKEGDQAMADSNVKDTVAYQLGQLNSRTESLQEGLRDLAMRVSEGFERQRQESERQRQESNDRLEKLSDRFDSRFLWMLGVVAIPLNLALLGFVAHLLGWV